MGERSPINTDAKEIRGSPNSFAWFFVLVKAIITLSTVSALIVYIYMNLSSFHG
jgi:hypothetical protein